MEKEFQMKWLREKDRNKEFPIFNLKKYQKKGGKK